VIGVVMIVLGFAAAAVHLWVGKQERSKGRVVNMLLIYALVFQVGVIGFVLGFIPHVFFAEQTARSIGWAPGSPFQFEVGIHDGAWGILGFLCVWFRNGFRIATGLGWALFMLGAAVGHVYQAVTHGDLAEYNFFTIFTDGFVAIELPILLYLDHRWNRRAPGSVHEH